MNPRASKAYIQRRLSQAFAECSKACRISSGGHEADRYLQAALDAATDGERRHRKAGRGMSAYKQPIGHAALYFAIKWFLDESQLVPDSWADACGVRDDVRFAYAARSLVESELRDALREKFADVLALDYSRDFVDSGRVMPHEHEELAPQ